MFRSIRNTLVSGLVLVAFLVWTASAEPCTLSAAAFLNGK